MGRDKVTIAVDLLDLQFAKTGQKTILEEYYKQFLIHQDPAIEFVFFSPTLPQFSRNTRIGIIGNHFVFQLWKQILLPLKTFFKRADVLFCNDYFAPLLTPGFKNVQVFHDAFFFEYPQHYNQLWLKLFKTIALPAAKKSAYIITTSQYAKQKINAFVGIPLAKIVPIYPGPKSLSDKTEERETFKAVKMSTELEDSTTHFKKISAPYLLHVGVWEKRKNIPFLLRAFSQFLTESNLNYQLVLAGAGNQRMFSDDTAAIESTIAELGLSQKVICTGYLSDEDLAKVYAGASLYVFPSYNEGFGIPVLEAFSYQLPVLVANNSCLPEVGGDAVLGFDPNDVHALATLMQQVLTDAALQESKRKRQKKIGVFFLGKSKQGID
jgi:glycosyltransferase involved in cell wall biosynthesis